MGLNPSIQAGDHLDRPCEHRFHYRSPNGPVQVDKFNPSCQACRARQITGEHDHKHDDFPYKAGCEVCSSQPMVMCRCGTYH